MRVTCGICHQESEQVDRAIAALTAENEKWKEAWQKARDGEEYQLSRWAQIWAENERLRFEADEYQRRHRIVRRRAERAEARVAALEEDVQELNRALAVEAETVAAMRVVLQKYADPRNYDGSPSAIDMDDGEAARAALARPTPTPEEEKG